MARVYSPLWPACWIQRTDRSRRSSSQAAQNMWDACIQALSNVPIRVREFLRAACDTDNVGASWQIWSSEAEASLTRAYHSAGGPALTENSSSVGRGWLQMCTKRVGSRFQNRIYRTDHADEFDVTPLGSSSTHHFPHYCDSAVGLCLSAMFLKAFGQTGFRTLDRLSSEIAGVQLSVWDPLVLLPFFFLVSWTNWIPPDLHEFYKWVLDACSFLNGFVIQVVRLGLIGFDTLSYATFFMTGRVCSRLSLRKHIVIAHMIAPTWQRSRVCVKPRKEANMRGATSLQEP